MHQPFEYLQHTFGPSVGLYDHTRTLVTMANGVENSEKEEEKGTNKKERKKGLKQINKQLALNIECT